MAKATEIELLTGYGNLLLELDSYDKEIAPRLIEQINNYKRRIERYYFRNKVTPLKRYFVKKQDQLSEQPICADSTTAVSYLMGRILNYSISTCELSLLARTLAKSNKNISSVMAHIHHVKELVMANILMVEPNKIGVWGFDVRLSLSDQLSEHLFGFRKLTNRNIKKEQNRRLKNKRQQKNHDSMLVDINKYNLKIFSEDSGNGLFFVK